MTQANFITIINYKKIVMTKVKKQLSSIILKMALGSFLIACGEEEPEITYYFETFSLEETTYQISLAVGDEDDAQPSNLVAAYVQADNDPQFDNSAVINLLPYDSEGNTYFPGPGWLQIRLPLNVKETVSLTQSQTSNTSTVLGDFLPDRTFQSIYIDADGRPHKTSGVVTVYSSEFTATDSYASYIGEIDIDLDIMDLESPSNFNGNIYVSAEKTKSSGGDSDEDGGPTSVESDVPGGCSEYGGPEFDIQFDAQCQAAWAYLCAGYSKDSDPVKTSCAIYKALLQGSPSAPKCPYCD